MNRTIILLILLLASLTSNAAKIKFPGGKCYIYRYALKDKAATNYTLDKPQRFLSQKSLERRQRQGVAIDSTDLPVCRAYIKLFDVRGTKIVGTSKWQNTVLVQSNDSLLLDKLSQQDIVRHAKCVFVAPDSIEEPDDIRWNVHEDFNRWDSVKNDPYGMARGQIEMLNGTKLHELDYTGRGMTIAVIDGGFQNYDRIPAFKETHIVGTRNFVPARIDKVLQVCERGPFHAIDHGTKVLSALAANAPEVHIGTAPDADYWLLRSEANQIEQPIEEDLWAMAVETADSVGADIISSSLGYYAYDEGRGNYRLQDLNGHTAFISYEASMLAGKGIVLCNSAGNSGMGQWKKIGVPADAPDIITVGAIDRDKRLASFSSIGPSQDGRIKPDVMAQGAPAALISGRGTLVHDMGTSFSTPIVSGLVACLWQALPNKNAREIIQLVRESASQYNEPTNIFGYGIPDFWKAYTSHQNL
jgi:subtilisin family serine protease